MSIFLRNKSYGSLAVSFVLVMTGFAGTASAQQQPPRIEIPNDTYDFGTIPEGQKVVRDFEVLNTGGSDLLIHQVVASCGCTAAVAQSTTVIPGGKTVVHVEFDSTGFSGERSKAARVNTNDPSNPSVFVTLKGTIESSIDFEPALVDWGEFVQSGEGQAPETQVIVRANDGSRLLSVSAGSSAVTVREVSRSDEQLVFLVSPATGGTLGDLRDRAIVSFEKLGVKRELSVPIIGKATGPIALKPSSVAMGIIEGDKPIERKVRLENHQKKPLKIVSLTADHPALSARLLASENKKFETILVVLDPRKISADLKGIVTIVFEDPSIAPIKFSVYGVRPTAE
jgi:hypothetical protein